MKKSDLEKFIKDQIEEKEQLVKFAKECLEYIFKDDPYKFPGWALFHFEEDVDFGIENMGELFGLDHYLEIFRERVEGKIKQEKSEAERLRMKIKETKKNESAE